MLAKVQKWGNSLALRIPKSYALEAKLEKDSDVEISLIEGQLVIRPMGTIKQDLVHLLSGITEVNLHDACDAGEAVGNENW
jgi:antitoxin MazE